MSDRKFTAGDFVSTAYIPGQATIGTADEWVIFKANEKVTITGVSWTPAAAVTGGNTHTFSIAVQNKGTAGVGTTAVTTTKAYTSGINSVAFDIEELTLSSTAADLNVSAGETLTLKRTITGNGLAQPHGLVEVRFQFRGQG